MYTISKQLRAFSAAHRIIYGYGGKCRHLHGHNYDVEIQFGSTELDQYGFVIDFDDITRYFDQWIQDNWDHCTLVSEDDGVLLDFVKAHQQKYYLFPKGQNTTVEHLARHLFDQMGAIMKCNPEVFHPKLQLTRLKLWETKSSYAVITK